MPKRGKIFKIWLVYLKNINGQEGHKASFLFDLYFHQIMETYLKQYVIMSYIIIEVHR